MSLTKALTPEGKTLKATWDGTETVQVYRRRDTVMIFLCTLKAQASTTNKTTLSGTMNIAPDPATDYLDFYYIDANMDYMGQDGRLATIAKRYDYCQEVAKSPASIPQGVQTLSWMMNLHSILWGNSRLS